MRVIKTRPSFLRYYKAMMVIKTRPGLIIYRPTVLDHNEGDKNSTKFLIDLGYPSLLRLIKYRPPLQYHNEGDKNPTKFCIELGYPILLFYHTLRFTLQLPTIILSLLSKAVGACSFLGACVVWAAKQLLQERSVVNKMNRMIKLR